jgi:glycosyltransferase involved in cell wall biosynthesis
MYSNVNTPEKRHPECWTKLKSDAPVIMRTAMSIPKIIHQTYKNKDIPRKYSRYTEHIVALHPGWEYKFYDDDACREAVGKYFPAFLPVYDRASVIQRVDIFRVIVVYGKGGFYMDLDIDCQKPLDDLCKFRCVFGEELMLTPEDAQRLGHRDRLRVANYMFGSEPGHPFLLHILRKMAEESSREILSENDILESTGPGLVTTVYHDIKGKLRDVMLLPNRDRTCPVTGGVCCHFGNYATHHHELLSSWRWEHRNGLPEYAAGDGGRVSEAEVGHICGILDSKIAGISMPEDIYILRVHKGKPLDGLSTVYYRSSVIGNVVEDTRYMSGKKVLVPSMAPLYTDKLSGKNTNVLYTTFETTKIPGYWLKPINEHYNHCIVPHEYVKEVFEASGVRIPVTTIHQGFTRYPRTHPVKPHGDVFRIGFLGVPYKRKNLFKLYQACVNLLSKIPGLRLAVHSALFFPYLYTPKFALMENSPFVEWTWGTMTDDWMADWYGRLSCYVFPSSGEGWSFTPRESLYLGVPTILSDIPVHREIIESGYCRAIPVGEKEDSNYDDGNTYGQWDRVSVRDVEEAIWDVYMNYGSYLIRAMQGSRWIENKWTNESSQQRVLEFMRSL